MLELSAQERRLLIAMALFVVGLIAIVGGQDQLHSGNVTCDSVRMWPGDECEHINLDTGVSYTLTYEEELASRHRTGRLAIGAGGLFFLGSGFFFWRMLHAVLTRRLIARRRAELAASRGWAFQAEHPTVLSTWRTGPLSVAKERPAWNVVSGEANGWQFQVLDYETADHQKARRVLTACVVTLPVRLPELQVAVKARHLPLVYSPTSSRNAVGLQGIDWAYAVRAVEPQVAKRLLNPAAITYIRENQLNFAVHRRWLSVIWVRKRESRKPGQSRVEPMVVAATELASLLSPSAVN